MSCRWVLVHSWLPLLLLRAHPQLERDHRVLRLFSGNGSLQRTVFLPQGLGMGDPQQEQEEEDGFVLVSDSSQNRFQDSHLKRKVKRRRRKKPTRVNKGTQQASVSNLTTNFKNPKFLNLFTIVKFDNDDCGEGGVCYHEYECTQLGGVAEGPCARGFGVCCTLETQCGETTSKAISVFVGSGELGACTLNIQKMECTKQIRLEFYSLDLEAPVDGSCTSDRLLVTGQNSNNAVPILCGANTGQHMHVDVDETEGPLTLSVISPSKRNFKIKVSQLCDGDPLLAPRGCLQYYVEPYGELKSFNYQDQQVDKSASLNNMNYAMCIRKNQGMCTIEYRNTGPTGEEYMFDINNVDLEGEPTVPEGEAGAEVFNCPDNYLAISGVRLCGFKLNDATTNADFTQNAPVIDRSNGPFMVSFFSSNSNPGRGFHLQYEQKPCI